MYDCCEQQQQEVLFKIEFKPEASTIVPKRTTCKQTEYDCKLGLTVCSDMYATRLHNETKQKPPPKASVENFRKYGAKINRIVGKCRT